MQEEEELCKSYRAAVSATAGPGEQFDLIDKKILVILDVLKSVKQLEKGRKRCALLSLEYKFFC